MDGAGGVKDGGLQRILLHEVCKGCSGLLLAPAFYFSHPDS